MSALDGEEGYRRRRDGAQEEHRRVAGGKGHIGQNDAGESGVADGVADEALPLVDAQGPYRCGHGR